MAVCQNLVPLVNIKIAGKWMFIPLKMVLIDIDPYPYSVLAPESRASPPACAAKVGTGGSSFLGFARSSRGSACGALNRKKWRVSQSLPI